NEPPVADNDSGTTHASPITVDVLANDSDPDGDTLSVTSVGTPQHGTAADNGDGTVTYTPNAGTPAGTDGFSYAISDGHGGTSSATVTITSTNQPPVAVNDSAGAHAGPVTVNVLANDSDPDGDALTVTSVGTPQHGTAVNNGN